MAALEEAKGAPQGPALDKLKKSELAERAERIVAGIRPLGRPSFWDVGGNHTNLGDEVDKHAIH